MKDVDVFSSCILFVKKKWISNLLACLLLPIKMEELGACKGRSKKKRKKRGKKIRKKILNWLFGREKKRTH